MDARGKQVQQDNGRQGAARPAADGAVDWLASLLAGRPRRRSDLRWRQRRSAPHELWLVIVDASASTRRDGALGDAKGFLAQLFDQAYRQRARLALITASGGGPTWHRQGLKASAALQPWLDNLGAGGGTPLLQGLQEAGQWLLRRQKTCPGERQRCVVVTDGRLKSFSQVQAFSCQTLLVDIEKGAIRLGRASQLAQALEADYVHLQQLPVLA